MCDAMSERREEKTKRLYETKFGLILLIYFPQNKYTANRPKYCISKQSIDIEADRHI